MIEIVDYQSGWQEEFLALAKGLKHELGPLALKLEHIGSTSVPNLAAKDIIDIQLSVAEFSQETIEAVIRAGYKLGIHRQDHLPPGEHDVSKWTKRIFQPGPGQKKVLRPVNLHMRLAGSANERYALLFRDYLRTHPAAAEGYQAVKKALINHHPEDDMNVYYDVKDPVCDIIMVGAEAWARQVAWQV
ncbi:MAG: GrpB family protein [Deinococcales bacterium]